MNCDHAERISFLSASRLQKIVFLTDLATAMITAVALRADEPEVLRPQWLDAIRLSGARIRSKLRHCGSILLTVA